MKKYLPSLVLLAAVLQIAVAYWFATQGFFNENSELRLFIQPAGYAFSIWGLIYTFATVYAVYQVIPSNDNEILRSNRPHVLALFMGSSAWLYASNLSDAWLWATVPILLSMGYVGFKSVTVKPIDVDTTVVSVKNFLSYQCLLVYAAWANVAMFVNIGAMLVEYNLFEQGNLWVTINVLLIIIVFVWIYSQYKKLRFSFWYGFIATWALIGVFVANGDTEGNKIIMYIAVILTIPFVVLSTQRLWKIINAYQISIEQK